MPEPEPADEPAARYDALAGGYARHWGPVIQPAAIALLDRLDGQPARGTRVLDLGTGTGTLAVEALARWPWLRVTGVDPSRPMLDLAEAAVTRAVVAGAVAPGEQPGPPFTAVAAFADELPFE
ncbi:MAG TPA: class I SAM-dependent methyltransferase, partial [Candidatus Limnocylindrales bacterium]